MELAAGSLLGRYAIDARIGAGGMGEVWRAHDPQIGRAVAIKVLPAALRGDDERLRRFEQEARTVGGLNHPNLLILHDVGRHDGAPYLVTELLDGESLCARLTRGPVPVKDAVRIAAEVARGLAAAHGAGVVHRDIKPDNVFVSADGRVKILDFGVAKLRKTDDDDPSRGSTLAATPETAAGAVVGTPGYMAPEQLGAGTVDARTDVFALGIVLHEMIAGTRPFAAASGVEESYAILKGTPPPLDGAPPEIERIVARCLEKRPEARFQSAADLAFALETPSGTSTRRAASAKPRRPIPWLAIACAGLAAALAITVIAWRRAAADTRVITVTAPAAAQADPSYRFRRVTFNDDSVIQARFTQDGRAIVLSPRTATNVPLVRVDLDVATYLPLGIDGIVFGVAPRGELLFLTADRDLERVQPGAGGAALVAHTAIAGDWGPGETIAAAIQEGGSTRIEYPLGHVLQRSVNTMAVRVSPDGAHLAFVAQASPGDSRGRIVIIDRDGHEVATSPWHPDITTCAWGPDGQVWYGIGSPDPDENGVATLDLAGHEQRRFHTPQGWYVNDVASDGRILLGAPSTFDYAYALTRGGEARDISWLDGAQVRSISRDGGTIAFLEGLGTGQTDDGYAAYLRTGDALPVPIGHAYALALLPDASAVIANVAGDHLDRIPVGGGTPVTLPRGAVTHYAISDLPSVSDDGKLLAFVGSAADGKDTLWIQSLDGGEPEPMPAISTESYHPLSPDGAWIAIAGEHGMVLISTRGAPDRTIPNSAGAVPISYAADGRTIFAALTGTAPLDLERVDVATGARTPWVKLPFPEHSRRAWTQIEIDGDGGQLAYSMLAVRGDLYVAEPVAK